MYKSKADAKGAAVTMANEPGKDTRALQLIKIDDPGKEMPNACVRSDKGEVFVYN